MDNGHSKHLIISIELSDSHTHTLQNPLNLHNAAWVPYTIRTCCSRDSLLVEWKNFYLIGVNSLYPFLIVYSASNNYKQWKFSNNHSFFRPKISIFLNFVESMQKTPWLISNSNISMWKIWWKALLTKNFVIYARHFRYVMPLT